MIRMIVISVILSLSVSFSYAQPPGGGGGLPGGEGDRINPEVPNIEDMELQSESDIDVDIENAGLFGNRPDPQSQPESPLAGELPFDAETFSTMMENFEVPDDWSQIMLGDEMPSRDEIMAMKDNLPVNIDLDSLDIQMESSAAATSAIVGYASTMLGKTVTPLYAGEYANGSISGNEVAQQSINQIYAQLDDDMQALLQQASDLSGVAYWALLEDGLALLYTGDCDLEQCNIQQDMVQVEITSGSAGVYAIYSDAVPSTTGEAQSLVQAIYPYLATLDLAETESSTGTAFFAFDIDMDSGDVTAYYTGVYGTESGQSIVYAVSGVGDAYINVMLGG